MPMCNNYIFLLSPASHNILLIVVVRYNQVTNISTCNMPVFAINIRAGNSVLNILF